MRTDGGVKRNGKGIGICGIRGESAFTPLREVPHALGGKGEGGVKPGGRLRISKGKIEEGLWLSLPLAGCAKTRSHTFFNPTYEKRNNGGHHRLVIDVDGSSGGKGAARAGGRVTYQWDRMKKTPFRSEDGEAEGG